jgi:hypothetical protein
MCDQVVPVWRRHQLERRLMDEYSVRLEVIDGQAIATHLADLAISGSPKSFFDARTRGARTPL